MRFRTHFLQSRAARTGESCGSLLRNRKLCRTGRARGKVQSAMGTKNLRAETHTHTQVSRQNGGSVPLAASLSRSKKPHLVGLSLALPCQPPLAISPSSDAARQALNAPRGLDMNRLRCVSAACEREEN